MCFSILFIHKMHVIGTHQLHTVFLGQFDDFLIGNLLHVVCLVIGSSHRSLMTLQLQIEITSENAFVPLDCFFRLIQFSLKNLSRNFSGDTSRADNQPFVVFLQLHPVGTGTHIVPLGPSFGYQLYQVVITFFILRQDHQVITALVGLSISIEHASTSHIHFTSEDRLEQFLFGSLQLFPACFQLCHRIFTFYLSLLQTGNFLLQILYFTIGLTIFLIDIVKELLNPEHIAMIGYGNTLHTVGYRLIHQTRDRSLAVENRILGMNM